MKLEPAEIQWTPDGQPYSAGFGDLYFSREDGLAETRHTFLFANHIEERFANLDPGAHFGILETGFGTGLNFLATVRAWKDHAPSSARLDFISIEAFPLRIEDLRRAQALWPELIEESELLLERYPNLTPGFHFVEISPQIRLILIFSDVKEALSQVAGPVHPELVDQLPGRIDACYLDGFAPRVNPAMWEADLFTQIAAICKNDATLSSFTAAGAVRRALQDSGFVVERKSGFGRKREMIVATLDSEQRRSRLVKPGRRKPLASWSLNLPALRPTAVTILGAGIAGLSLADSLSRRSIPVTLVDACGFASAKASGNSQAALFARLSTEHGDLEDFALAALEYAGRYYRDKRLAKAFHASGLIQLPRKPAEEESMRRIADRFAAAFDFIQMHSDSRLSELAGIPLKSGGLWMPQSGWIDPATLAESILISDSITTLFDSPVDNIRLVDDAWHLFDEQDTSFHQTSCLVICAGHKSNQFSQLSWLPTRSIRGQVTQVRHPQLQKLQSILCSHGYLAPAESGLHSVGATYDLDNDSDQIADADNTYNLDVLDKLTGIHDAMVQSARAGVRCTTPDYLPLCGPAPDIEKMQSVFAQLGKDAKSHIPSPGQHLPGLFLNLGYGSRGFCYAPLCAEHLASQILGSNSPLPHHINAALNPSRFIIRKIIRNKE